MDQRHVTWAKYAAGIALFGAVDTALGTGALQALAELCLSDPTDDMVMPTMPMEHSGHAMPWFIAAGGFASVAGVGNWVLARTAQKSAWAPARLPILAGLAQVALAQKNASPADLVEAWNAALTPGIDETDAKVALARFAKLSPQNRRALMANLQKKSDRAAFACAALRILRDRGDPSAKGRAMLETLADDMGMSGLEIFDHWDAAFAPSRTAVAVGEVRALGAIAMQTILTRATAVSARLEVPLKTGLRATWLLLRRVGRAALVGFVQALAAPRQSRGDDQLTALRRRFRRRSLSSRLQLAVPQNMPFRREVS